MADGQSHASPSRRRSIATVAACSAFALLLSACESNGGTRWGSIGTPGAGSGSGGSGSGSGGSGSGSGGGSGGGIADGGGSGTGGGTGGTGGGTGGTGGGTGTGSGGTTATLGQLSPVLVTAGNAVLGVADGQGTVTTPIATALPVLQPVTGTITRVLEDTGTVLVDAGEGRTLLLQGAQGVVGDLVTIDVGGRNITTGLDGTSGAIGVGVLGSTQPSGTLASVGVLNAGNTVLADVNGIAGVQVTNITSPTGGIAENLLNVALGGNQLLGSGDPALVNANILPGGTSTTGGLLAPVTNVVSGVTGGTTGGSTTGLLAPVTNVVSDLTGGATSGGLTSTVQQVTQSVLAPTGLTAGATAGATVEAGTTTSTGGLLAPVTGIVSGTLNSLGSGLGITQP